MNTTPTSAMDELRTALKAAWPASALGLLLALNGCSHNQNSDSAANSDAEAVSKGISSAPADATTPAADPAAWRTAFVGDVESQLKDIDAKIADLAAKTPALKEEVKAQADQALAALRDNRAKLGGQLDRLKAAAADKWQEAQTGLSAALDSLRKACADAASKFQG